jgi:hypothetical protein
MMPRSCVFDTARNAILVEATGVFTEQEFRLGTAAAVKDPRFRPDMRTLVDFSGVTLFKISALALDEFVRGRHFSTEARRAFVVSPGFGATFVTFGMNCGVVEQIRIFHDRKDALAWLNESVPAEKVLT